MLALFGTLALWCALLASIAQSVPTIIGHYKQQPHLLAFARPGAIAQFVFILIAYILLTVAFVQSDFTITYVGMNSHPLLPFIYRLTAVWGGHEGSILLWIFLLNIWSFIFINLQRKHPLQPLTTAVLGIIGLCFLLFLILTSNPFAVTDQLITGNDLNPLLQDPGFVIHPPMLYTGYAGFALPFAITMAALLRNQMDVSWARLSQRYALAAWCFLTLGITLGSWWAYRVLGWGGYWAWDPVENASLLPWISGTALLHVLIICEKRQATIGWAALLAIISFALSLLGTFLVRSGVLISAHTFASDPSRGLFLLVLLAFVMTTSLVIYISKIKLFLLHRKPPFHVVSRESSLLINSGILMVAMLTVLVGTIFPLIVDALRLDPISVGAPYFNIVMMPLIFILMTFMGIGPLCQWQEQNRKILLQKLALQAVKSFIAALALLWGINGEISMLPLLSMTLSLWIVFSVLGTFRLKPGMAFAHLGFAILIIGILLSSLLNQEREARIKPGNAISVGPYQFFFIDVTASNGSNYRGVKAKFDVMKKDKSITTLYPEKRIYFLRDMVMTRADISPGIFRDLYLSLGEPYDDGSWSIRAYYKPFVRWIWAGSIIMMLAGLFTLYQHRSGKKSP